jgi:hypothetical protein
MLLAEGCVNNAIIPPPFFSPNFAKEGDRGWSLTGAPTTMTLHSPF